MSHSTNSSGPSPRYAIRIAQFLLLGSLLIAPYLPTWAQPSGAMPRIGLLIASNPTAVADRIQALQRGLVELGYVEGKNITIEQRWADGKADRLPELAGHLIGLKVDIVLSTGPQSTRAAMRATSTTPIVMGFDNDPVGNGFIASLAHPGGNITGLSTLAPEISGKQLEILKDVLPSLTRVAVLGSSSQPGTVQALKELEAAAKALAVGIKFNDVPAAKDMEKAFQSAIKEKSQAVLVLNSPVFNSPRTQIAGLAAKARIPAIYWATEFVEAGGLMTYSVSFSDLFHRAATYVDKILKGRKPADLPVEQPRKFEFIVNLKTAKQIGLTIPPNVLARADRIIK